MNFYKNKFANYILTVFLLSGIMSINLYGTEYRIDKGTEDIIKSYTERIKTRSWKPLTNRNTISAFRFKGYYDKMHIVIDSEEKSRIYHYTITISINGVSQTREFRFAPADAVKDNIRNITIPFLDEQLDNYSAANAKTYKASISMGYNRTHDNSRFYPEKNQGSYYSSASLLYDPASLSESEELLLETGDYLSFDVYYAYDSHMRENSFNINLLLYGKNTSKKTGVKEERVLSGFFNGFEYFRPGFYDSTLKWNRQVYKKQPHIQYTIWRALQFDYRYTRKTSYIFNLNLMAGFGPSINSSLTATSVTEDEEKVLSHIFKSIKYRRQNYYYSITIPAAISAGLDKFYNFKLGAGFNIYGFYPVESEKAYDWLEIGRTWAGYYITDELLFQTTYEYWYIRSKVRRIKADHSWNRLVIEVKYLF